MRNGLNLYRDPGTEGGGGSAASPSPAAAGAPASSPASAPVAPAAPASTGKPAGAPAAVPGAAVPAAVATAPAPGAAPVAPFKSALEGLPARGTAEYMKAFNELPRERQQAIEAEVLDRDMNPKKYEDLDKNGPGGDPAAAAGDDAPLGWTDEQLAAMDPHTQKSIKAMQEIIDQVAPYVQDGKLKEGMTILTSDPLVKQRMAQLANLPDPYAIPEELEDQFDPASYITKDELAQLDLTLRPKESRELLATSLQKAYEAGAKNAAIRADYEKSGAVAFERRKGLFTQQLGGLMEKNPSLKSDKPFNDPAHPLNEYIKWSGEHLGDEFLEAQGQEVGYAAFLASKGRLNQSMAAAVKNQQLAFIRAVENGDKKVAMMRPGGPASPPVAADPSLGGVDPKKYLADPLYRRNAFNAAKPEVRRKLEVLTATGKF